MTYLVERNREITARLTRWAVKALFSQGRPLRPCEKETIVASHKFGDVAVGGEYVLLLSPDGSLKARRVFGDWRDKEVHTVCFGKV